MRRSFRRRSYRQTAYYRPRSPGYGNALENIRQADALRYRFGGMVDDVVEYFFTLEDEDLTLVLDEYGRRFGSSARNYAKETIPKWQIGAVKMSGSVIERLVDLLPQFMPVEDKYQLVEKLWRHVAPSSHRTVNVNPADHAEEIITKVRAAIQQDVAAYKIPDEMERSFTWLSQDDVAIKQLLLNHIRQIESQLAEESFRNSLNALRVTIANGLLKRATHTIKIGRNEIQIVFSPDVIVYGDNSLSGTLIGIFKVLAVLFIVCLLLPAILVRCAIGLFG